MRQLRGLGRTVAQGLLRTALVLIFVFVTMSVLAKVVPPISTLMIRDLVMLRGYDRQWIALDATAPVLRRSIIASEDQAFCAHNGVQWDALRTQWERWRAGEDARGASTLSMQVARNLFLWQGQSVVRKALEVPVALWLDFVLGKRRMLEVYLNIAELGPQLYGFEAAAQRAYGVSAGDVSANQAGLLVATLPLPSARDPASPTSRQRAIARTIAQRARGVNHLMDCLEPPPPSPSATPPVPSARPDAL
ncbi:MAG: transglycosylase domain-containing protein [Pseudomonadota bacterium]